MGTLMMNHIGGVMISVVGHGFETPSGQTKDYKIGEIQSFCLSYEMTVVIYTAMEGLYIKSTMYLFIINHA
jgi:hypothetical protein